ncbi:hypothetical protein Tco_0641330 [Tanacetum coccineum]
MVVVEWKIRDYEDPVDEQESYSNYDETLFSLKIYLGGFFTEPPGRCYTNGTFNYVDLFSVIELQEMLKTLGYKNKKNKMYYHFKIPNNNLDHGLQALGNDADVMNLVRLRDLVSMLLEGPSFNAEKEKETTDYVVSKSNEEVANEDETGSESSESDNSKDSDYIVDEDNVINEVDVDMQEF